MANPDNARVLADERALSEAEATVAQAELAVWTRLAALDQGDLPRRAQAALGRVEALESAGVSSADFPKIKAALQAMLTPLALASEARTTALAARQNATSARSAAATALTNALAAVEPTKAARRRDVDAIDTYVGKMEAAVRARQTGAPTAAATQAVPPRGRG